MGKPKNHLSYFKKDKNTGEIYYERQTFETRKAGDTRLPDIKNEPHTDIFLSMINSEAWANLSGNAVKLYICMKQQAFSKNKNKNVKKGAELKAEEFFFNKALMRKAYPYLYGGSLNQYYKAKKNLIENGFIECPYHSANPTEKDIYKLSDKWQMVERKKRGSSMENLKKAKPKTI